MVPNFIRSLLGLKGARVSAPGSGLPPELKFPVFITGDGGSGRTMALDEIARRASVERRIVLVFDLNAHFGAAGHQFDRDHLATSMTQFIKAVATHAICRVVVRIDDIDLLDHGQVAQVLETSDVADLALTCSSHYLANLDAAWRPRLGSVIAMRVTPPALSARLDTEGVVIGRGTLAELTMGESLQVDLETGRVSALAWPAPPAS